MASLDRPRHGWEGISNGGEIWGSGNSGSGSSTFDDDDFLIDADPERLNKILRELDVDDKPNLGDFENEDTNVEVQKFDYNTFVEKEKLIDDIVYLMVINGNIPNTPSAINAEKADLLFMSVEELRVIKEEWQKANLTSKSGRGM